MPPLRLMNTPSQFVLSKLSKALYVDFLNKAKSRGFSFVQCSDFLPDRTGLPSRFILLRHDIDFAPSYSLKMAELESVAGVRSTFFVLVDGGFYNPLQTDVIRQIRRIQALGHEIGLHFAASSSVDDDIGREVAFRLEVLNAIAGVPVRSYTQHDVVNAGLIHVALPDDHYPCVNATQIISDYGLLYVSDSAMMWRQHTFESALDEDRNLCLVAHPHSWLHSQDDYVAMIREFESHETERVHGQYEAFVEALSGYYSRRLTEGV